MDANWFLNFRFKNWNTRELFFVDFHLDSFEAVFAFDSQFESSDDDDSFLLFIRIVKYPQLLNL